jgi:hypothetical protein
MSTYDETLLAARFAALAPEPLPGDWADVLRRSGVAQQRPWRLGRFGAFRGRRRRRVLVLAAAALVVVVATACALAVRAFIVDRGFIGLPPKGATPSAPESGELVVQWRGRSATLPPAYYDGRPAGPIVLAWVYADGRIIWSRRERIPEGASEFNSGYLEQRLTPEGVAQVRSAVVALLDRSRSVLETVPADDDPWPFSGRLALQYVVPGDYGSAWGGVGVRDGDRLVRLGWVGLVEEKGSKRFHEILDDLREHSEVAIATPEQLSALRRVDALLTDPASVLPSSAWAVREVRAYVPSHYAVCIDTSPPKDASELLSLLPPRAADVLRDKSRTRHDGEVVEAREGGTVVLGRSLTYCSKLATEDARDVAEALSGLDPDARVARHTLAYLLAEAVNNLNPTTIWFEPYFPHGQFTISGGG